MTAEFWNSFLTEKSWEILQKLKKQHKFILIGGWAIYLLTNQQKSKDIDIIGIEGKAESGWVLVDCGDIVIHIMQKDIREFYDLEGLWGGDTLVDPR